MEFLHGAWPLAPALLLTFVVLELLFQEKLSVGQSAMVYQLPA